ncbi:hypothetical protein LCGC14_0609580 [marine sediment metagenome]|uniref:Uncharacterized protein n=1 Tax=marine sediment metagenome TaxID=412755 RepID=A0A0F9TUC1_9ZZZZ
MPNGEMLEELKKLAAEDEISIKSAIRLILTSQVEVHNDIAVILKSQRGLDKVLDSFIIETKEEMKSIRTCIRTSVRKIEENSVIKLGLFIKKYPKITYFLGVTGFVIMNLWFVEDFRSLVLEWLKIPIP